jgi:hypothetical protein
MAPQSVVLNVKPPLFWLWVTATVCAGTLPPAARNESDAGDTATAWGEVSGVDVGAGALGEAEPPPPPQAVSVNSSAASANGSRLRSRTGTGR